MSVTVTKFLRNALYLDALASGAAGLLMIAGAPLLSPLLALPSSLLVGAGLVLVPFVATLIVVARRSHVSRLALIDILALNAFWVAASFGLLASGLVQPSALGIAFVAAQALVVGAFTVLQFIGLRRAGAAPASV